MRWLSVTCLALGVIALVNIIFLSFIDAVSQQSRIAISYALGARFRRLVAQPSARFALFAIIGMAVGLLIDLELRRHIASFLQLTPDQIAFSTPQKIAVVATLLGAAIGATVPWFITVRHAIRDVILLLRGQVASSPPRGRYGLLAVQAAVASSLLLIAVQYWVATRRLQAAQLQFAPKEMLVARIRTDDPERMTEAYAWRTRMVAQPEVVDVAFATMIPTEGSMTIPFRATDGNAATVLYANAVDERYFRVTRMRLIKGRGISAEDGATGRLVAVINETLDRQLSEAGMPFGTQCLGSSTTFCGIRVVGVVEDSKYLDLLEQPLPFAFTALAQRAPGVPIVAHVRVRPGTVPQVTSPLWRDILYTGTVFRSLSDVFRSRLAPWTTGVVLFSVVASLGLLIAVAGVSTLVWSLIRSRSRELAVRAAVGAGPAMLARTILSRLAGWIFPGVLSGLVAGSYLSRLLGDRAITPSPELAALVGVTLIATYFGAAALSAWSVATSPISMRHLSADS
jgi:hypothetical protein